jgi:glutamate N-acetyltransferase/amino-acid N-acetyltransferase
VTTALPLGFSSFVTNVGVKDSTKDFTVVMADGPCSAAGVFTQSRFAGPSVVISRRNVANLSAQAVVVVSKNANVATGEEGMRHAEEVTSSVASALGLTSDQVLIASTGVIGRLYPIDNIRAGIASLPFPLPNNDADDVARGIMTTDTVHKISSATITGSSARVVGVAKGVGMIEPNMATLIAMVFTDAQVEPKKLNDIFRGVINKTLNCVSVDTDTSTSDTAIVLASGAAGTVDDAQKQSRAMVKVQKLSLKSQLTMLAMLNKQRPWPSPLSTHRLSKLPCMAQTQTGVALQWQSVNAANTQTSTRKKLLFGLAHKRCTPLALMNQDLLNSVSTCVVTTSRSTCH